MKVYDSTPAGSGANEISQHQVSMRRLHEAASDLCWFDAQALSNLYRKGQVSPVDVARAVLAQTKRVAAAYNAFVHVDEEGALTAARESEQRWLHDTPRSEIDGIPATIKDLMTVKGWHTRFGSAVTPDVSAQGDAPSVAALRAAGAVLIGSTSTPEFGWKGVTDNPVSGLTSNPYDDRLTPGGSSGGAAVAALMGCGNLHLGTDGGGSVRIPAAFTGVVGHKPSFGRIPYFPPSAFGTVGHLGAITRTAAESALMLDFMTVRDVRDWNQPHVAFRSAVASKPWQWRNKRIGLWLRPPIGGVDPQILERVTGFAKSLEREGAAVEVVSLPSGDVLRIFNTIWFSGASNRVGKVEDCKVSKVDAGLLAQAEIGRTYSAAQYAEAMLQRAVFGSHMDELLTRYDLLMSPTTPVVAFAKGHDVPPDSEYRHWTEWASFNFPLNLSQQPACSVPVGVTRTGLPIGLQLIGARGNDAEVLSAASSVAEIVGNIDELRFDRG